MDIVFRSDHAISMDAIRFGVQTVPQHTTWRELRAAWDLVDASGYDTAWTFDHFYPIFSDPHGPCFEGWIALTALAAATTRVRVGTLVTGNTYRHPAVLANMAATLDHTSGGRLILGVGAAWFDLEHKAYGIEYPPVGERIARFEEACEVMTRLLTETEVNFAGRFYTLTAAHCEPKPVQKPRVPLMIGGGGEKKTLRVVARFADEWNWFGTVESFRSKLEILRAHCGAVGRDFAEIEPSWAGEMRVTGSAAEKTKVLEEMSARRNQPAADVEANCLVGSPSEIEARIRTYEAVGVRHFIICANAPYDLAGLKAFAETVIPRFR